MSAVACSSSSSGSTSAGGATANEIASCHTDCDKMKFFNCNSSDEQSQCYDDCGNAAPAQIAKFDGCANSSVCDPSCRNDIAPPASNGGSPTGTGASPVTCATACQKVVSCNLIPQGGESECETECQQRAYQYQIDCVNNTDCSKIEAQCGNPTSEGANADAGAIIIDSGVSPESIVQCQAACSSLQQNGCLSSSDESTCVNACANDAASKDDTFTACVQGSSDCTGGSACYAAFVP